MMKRGRSLTLRFSFSCTFYRAVIYWRLFCTLFQLHGTNVRLVHSIDLEFFIIFPSKLHRDSIRVLSRKHSITAMELDEYDTNRLLQPFPLHISLYFVTMRPSACSICFPTSTVISFASLVTSNQAMITPEKQYFLGYLSSNFTSCSVVMPSL